MYQTPKNELTTGVGCATILGVLAISAMWNGLLIWGGLELVDLAFDITTLGYWQATAFGFGLSLLAAPALAILKSARP